MAMQGGMQATEIAAWWGAAIATVVLLWDVYKWKTQGPRLVMRVSPNMEVWGDPSREGKTWVSVTVSNVGDRPTTMTGIGMEYYGNWYRRIRGRPDRAAVFPNPSDAFPLPKILNPGEQWLGLVPQERADKDFNLEEMSRTGHVVIWLGQSHSERAMRRRLTIRFNSNGKKGDS